MCPLTRTYVSVITNGIATYAMHDVYISIYVSLLARSGVEINSRLIPCIGGYIISQVTTVDATRGGMIRSARAR